MKVGARITIATSALVTVTLGLYALFELRSAASERTVQIEREARDVAATIRASLEAIGIDRVLASSNTISERLSRASAPWNVIVVPFSALEAGKSRATPQQVERLRRLIQFPELDPFKVQEGDEFILVVSLRVPSPSPDEEYVAVGSLEVSRSTGHLAAAFRDDLIQTLLLIAFMAAVTFLSIGALTRSLMTRPIEKLLAGIDDVARGDLSHVLLSERDDEIGALAARFNDMTQSLRESRAETEQQNEARLELEQRLSRSEKLATMGQLAAEIAHEVGTPLNVIAGRSKSLARKAQDTEVVHKNAAIISEQTARITRIIQRLLDFTRRKVGVFEPEPVDLGGLCLTTVELLEGKFTAGKIEHTLELASELPPVKGDRDRLQQVLLNLLLNAIEAMPDGGELEVGTSVVTRRRPGLEVAPEQEYVVVAITDSGVGIPLDQREKIFEPFYTSKHGDGGTGLGLAVCYGIVKEHDGWIHIADGHRGGTVFSVFLPVAD